MPTCEETRAEHEIFARRFYGLWNSGDTDGMYAMLDEHVKDGNAASGEHGREGVKSVLDHIRGAIPNLRYTIDEIVSNGVDRFVVYLTATGTQTGELFGNPPKGKTAAWKEVRLCVLGNGKVVAHRAVLDSLTMMQQLGHIAPPAGRESW
jgi:predicted ester cyclase